MPAGSDKIVHFALYFVFAFLAARAAQPGRPQWRMMAIASVVLIAWAAADELHQLFIPGRSAEVGDGLVDTIGVLGGLAARRALRLGTR